MNVYLIIEQGSYIWSSPIITSGHIQWIPIDNIYILGLKLKLSLWYSKCKQNHDLWFEYITKNSKLCNLLI